MWKQIATSLATAAMMTSLSLAAGEKSADGKPCPADKKEMTNCCCCCVKMCPEHCCMRSKTKFRNHKKMVKITPVQVQKENDNNDPGFIAIVEEYTFAADPVFRRDSRHGKSAGGKYQTGKVTSSGIFWYSHGLSGDPESPIC